MSHTFSNDLSALLDEVEEPMVDIRRDLHAHPELAFEEHRTTQVITDRLVHLGYEIRPCPTVTGVVARLTGAHPGKRVMVRADMDALPVTEERADVTYASQIHGVMHACGHDVHVAGLLGVADLLARRQDELSGEYTLLFQPAEEAVSGAKAMIEGGVLDDNPADYVIGAHVTSLAPVGFVATRPGIMMSQAQMINVRLDGKGGHGAMATTDGNVILAVSYLAPLLASVVEGLIYEGTQCACSAGVLQAGTANNVVPRRATLKGTLRTFTAEQTEEAVKRLGALCNDAARTFSVACDLQFTDATPAVSNNVDVFTSVVRSAAHVVGEAGVLTFPPVTPSDDMSEFLNRVPGCYVFVGGALADGTSGMHHSPDFAIADEACRVVAGVLAVSAVDLATSVN
ncbi:MAG: M20 family metallopeptidase [Acidimicrobiales bacterium]